MTMSSTKDVAAAWLDGRIGPGSAVASIASVIDVQRIDAEIAALPDELRHLFEGWARAIAAADEPLPEPIGGPPPMASGLLPALRSWVARASLAAE